MGFAHAMAMISLHLIPLLMALLLPAGSARALMPQSARQQEVADLKQRAGAGDARAQVQVGLIYLTGDGAKADDSEAAQWFRKSGET